jgi:hypothetical protein
MAIAGSRPDDAAVLGEAARSLLAAPGIGPDSAAIARIHDVARSVKAREADDELDDRTVLELVNA